MNESAAGKRDTPAWRQAAAWNRAHAPRRIVEWMDADGTPRRGRTSEHAFVRKVGGEHVAFVLVKHRGMIRLDQIQPCPPRAPVGTIETLSAEWICQTCKSKYKFHPLHLDYPDAKGMGWLFRLCDGRAVRLDPDPRFGGNVTTD